MPAICSMNDKKAYLYSKDKLSFYIAANDQDILSQVSRLMGQKGLVGVMDTAGRVHYVIDGRKGSPYASRRIMETSQQIAADETRPHRDLHEKLPDAVAAVLLRHRIRRELKGYRYLRFALLAAGLDEAKLRPISKTLYPLTAEHYRVKVSQVERDIRYALQKTPLKEEGLTTTAAICRLYDEMIQEARQGLSQKKASVTNES